MAIERADSILDIPAITQEVNQYVALIQKSQAALVELFNITKQYKDSNIVNLTQNTEKLTVAMNGSLETTKQVTAANEKLTKTIVAHKEKTDDEIKSQIQAREALKARTDQIKVQGDAYKQLTLKYQKAEVAAKALSAEYGINSKQAAVATKEAKSLGEQISAINKATGNAAPNTGVGRYAEGIKEFAKQAIQAYGALYLLQKGFSFIKESIKAFEADQLAATKLNNILQNLGREDALADLNKEAAGLSATFGTFEKKDVTDVFQKLITYGKLTKNQILELTPVIIDFAAKQGIDLPEATGILTKALEGNSRGLRDYGINIKDGHNATERFGIIMSELKPRVDGAALAIGDTLAGSIKKTDVAIDELKIQIGQEFAPAMTNLEKGILQGIKGIPELFEGIRKGINSIIEPAKIGALYLLKIASFGLNKSFDNYVKDQQQQQKILESNKNYQNALEYAEAFRVEASKKKVADQEKDLSNQRALMNMDLARYNQLKASGQLQTTEGQRTRNELFKDIEVVKALQGQLKSSKDTRLLGFGGDTGAGKEDNLKELEDFAKGFISILDKIGEYDEKTGENALTGFQKEIKQAIDENKNFNREIEELRTEDQEKLKKHFADGEIELKQYTDVSRGINEHAHADQVAAELALQNRIKEIKDKFEKERDAKAFADAQKQHDKMAKEMADKSKQDVEDELAAAQLAFQKSGKLKDQLKEIQKQKDVSDHSAYAQFGEFGTTPDSGRLTTELGKNAETATSDASKAKEDAAVKVIDKIKNYSVDAEHIIGGIIDDETTKKLNALNKIEVAQQKAYEKEIAGVNLSTLSQQDKAAKLKILESDRQVQVEQNARAQKKIDEDKAKFDKAKSIVSIIESTAEGVIKALVSTPPDIPLALIVGALGASELAIAIAQPIPHYKEGTMKGHTGGIAVVGDGGVRELILEPGKDPYYSPAVPTVMSLAKHTQVIPIDQVEEMRRGSMQVNPFGYLVGEGNTPREIVNQLKIQNSIQQKQLEALARIANKRDRPIIIKNDVSNYEKRVRI